MLDLGVGGGRTTIHFAPLVAEYVATDYAEEMLKACRTRLAACDPAPDLLLADVRDLTMFPDASFDLVLFSFNGLGEIGHDDQRTALAEIHRVLKPGGLFLFSSHNLLSIDQLFRLRLSRHPKRLFKNLRRYFEIRRANRRLGDRRALRRHASLHDYGTDWTKSTYYVDPEEQLAQLSGAGFRDSEIYEAGAGGEPRPAGLSTQPWLHYLARA
jgi:ubiquinone/menaquinone biosynthesis C-methylase UbiE